jgi:hypothetical protein
VKRSDLAHILRAAAEVAGDSDILIIGSQAVLASREESDLPAAATMSMEADVAFFDDEAHEKGDRVDGAIGEGSEFHRTFGYYAQGVGVETATLPTGWRERAIPFTFGDHGRARAVCLEPHDLVVSKLMAGREKDVEFARALVTAGVVECTTLRERIGTLPVVPGTRRRILTIVDRLEKAAAS